MSESTDDRRFPTIHRADGCLVDASWSPAGWQLVVSLGDESRSVGATEADLRTFWSSRHTDPRRLALAVERLAGQLTERSP
jgi:hypothetical protein